MNVVAASDAGALGGLLHAGWHVPASVVEEVATILAAVQERGDAAIGEYARRYDGEDFDLAHLRVAIPMLESARAALPSEITEALGVTRERIARFHERQRQPDVRYVDGDGTRYAVERRALRSVAIYASKPGAAIAVLIGAVPAKIGGVSRVIVLSPPQPGPRAAALLLACAMCGVDELYAVGGAQAIAAAAFGTESIARVDKIVGRGGIWTTEAKRQVFGRCGVDAIAGPPEILVVADDGASSEYVVAEILAAAEFPGVNRLAVLSESRSLLEAVAQLIDTLDLRTFERHEFVSEAISHCRLIEARNRDELFDLVNRLAPAYLSLQVRDTASYVDRIQNAGTVFAGDTTPWVSGEYLAGTSCVVPTAGTAHWASSLSLVDFTRTFAVVENTAERIAADAPTTALLADFDGLPQHAQTARMRSER